VFGKGWHAFLQISIGERVFGVMMKLSGLLKATEDRPQFHLRSNLIISSGPSSSNPAQVG